MLRSLILLALACALAADGASARRDGGTPAAFVTLTDASQIVGVDLGTGRVVARVRVPDGPSDVASYGGRHLLVVSPPAGTLTLVDSFERRVLHVWRGLGRPVAVATNGSYAYVADEEQSRLVIVDLGTWRIRGRVAVRPAPRDVAVGDAALLTHAGRSRRLSVAELSWGGDRVLRFRRFPVAGAAVEVVRQADSAFAYLSYGSPGLVGGVDWGTERVRWQRRVGTRIGAIAVDHYHGRRLWVADRASGVVLGLSTETGRVLRRLPGCRGANGVAVVGTAWVVASCRDANALAVWSQRTWERRLFRVGRHPSEVAEIVLP